MTQVGEGREAAESAPPLMTFGSPTVGEILAERYQLEEHINDDSAGRQVWRGVDVILRRPVAVVLRYPGGDSAMEMLQAAVTASRVVHPNLVGVYDAIDEGERAYVVREWVEGAALREHVTTAGPLDAARATAVAHCIAAAVAAVHATEMVHGNIHPGTVLIADDGRVVLADARSDAAVTAEHDVRAIGGVIYYALTGHWPHTEVSRSTLPDAVRDASGTIAAPRQMRAGVPPHLDDLTVDLLDQRLAAPSADVLAAELSRLDDVEEYEDIPAVGPLRFAGGEEAPPEASRPAGKRIAIGIAALLVIAVIGLLLGLNALPFGTPDNGDPDLAANPSNAPTSPTDGSAPPLPTTLAIGPNQVRIVDPAGDGNERPDAARTVDGDSDSAWETDHYRSGPKFSSKKPGMGILIDLGAPRTVTSVQVEFSASGATTQLRYGTRDPGAGLTDLNALKTADGTVNKEFKPIGPAVTAETTTVAFGQFNPDAKYRYLLVWITSLPRDGSAGWAIGIQEITVKGS